MGVAIAASVVGLLVVLVAYYRDEPLEQRRLHHPQWDLLPDPADLARTEFPLAFPGYDPATVEVHFDTLARAYADLLAVAPPEVVARARRRAAVREGLDPADPRGHARDDLSPPVPEAAAVATPAEAPDAEALRAEAALAHLDAQHRGGA